MEEERDSIPGFFKVVRVTFGRSRLVESSTTPLHQRFPFRGLMVPLYAPSKLLVTVMSVRPFLFRFCFFFLILDQTKHARTFLTEFQNKTKETKIEREREKKKILDISSSSGACPPSHARTSYGRPVSIYFILLVCLFFGGRHSWLLVANVVIIDVAQEDKKETTTNDWTITAVVRVQFAVGPFSFWALSSPVGRPRRRRRRRRSLLVVSCCRIGQSHRVVVLHLTSERERTIDNGWKSIKETEREREILESKRIRHRRRMASVVQGKEEKNK